MGTYLILPMDIRLFTPMLQHICHFKKSEFFYSANPIINDSILD
jgi:hypothetical protein